MDGDAKESTTPSDDDDARMRNGAEPETEGKAPGKRRAAGRIPASAGIKVLAAFTVLAVGVVAGLALSPSRAPQGFESQASPGRMDVASEEFADERSVSLSVSVGDSSPVVSPRSGMVTDVGQCVPGGVVDSGTVFIGIDGQPQMALHLSLPLYRALAVGSQGADAAALNAELRRLGQAAPDSDTVTGDTIGAFNALAAGAGSPQSSGVVDSTLFLWIPEPRTTIESCSVLYGGQTSQGETIAVTTPQPRSLATPAFPATATGGSGTPPDRILTLGGQEFTIPSDAGRDGWTTSDEAMLAAVAASSQYAAAMQDGDVTGGGTARGQVTVSATWRLATPLTVTEVPPAALYDIQGAQACLAVDGSPQAVTIIASQLGKTMVQAGGAPPAHVDVPPEEKPCR